MIISAPKSLSLPNFEFRQAAATAPIHEKRNDDELVELGAKNKKQLPEESWGSLSWFPFYVVFRLTSVHLVYWSTPSGTIDRADQKTNRH